jgi:hypothetical protein
MIDIATESTLTLADAAKLLPSVRMGRPVSFQCILRWVQEGSRGPDGRTVKLEAVRLGGRWITSKEAMQRFAEALTPQLTVIPGCRRGLSSPAPTPRPRKQPNGTVTLH